MPSVTVLMPVYNAMPYLPLAVASIQQQTYADWTMVAVDDGSNDGSAEYLNSLSDPRIEVLHQRHQGPAVASNRALATCQSDFIARMDADDVAYPDRLAAQVSFLRHFPEVGLLGSQIEPLGTVRAGRPSKLPTVHERIFNDLLHRRHAMCNPTIMCRTALLREIGGYETDGVLDDWAMFLAMGQRARLANLNRVLLSYRIHTGSLNGRKLAGVRLSIAFAAERARRQLAAQPVPDFKQFTDEFRRSSWWRRAGEAIGTQALLHYRLAQADILGGQPLRGYPRLALAATLSPAKTWQRLIRGLRNRRSESQVLPAPSCRKATT